MNDFHIFWIFNNPVKGLHLTFIWMSFLSSHLLSAQSVYYHPSQDELLKLDEVEAASKSLLDFHMGVRPYRKHSVTSAWIRMQDLTQGSKDFEMLSCYHADVFMMDTVNRPAHWTEPRPLWKYFYQDGQHFYSLYRNEFSLTIDPLIQLSGGYQKSAPSALYLNQRGFNLQLTLDRKLAASFTLLETQQAILHHVYEYEQLYAALPGAALYKAYSGKILSFKRAYDYLLAEGGLSYDISRHVNLSLGHGKHFIGFGMRSLFLSEFAPPQFFLKLQAEFWKIRYQSIFSELSAGTLEKQGNHLLGKKYMASHVLSFNLSKRWNLGLFESVVFARENHFEFQYLNPVILYRFVEQALGSPDNAFLGFQSKYLINSYLNVYGQCLFDELVIKEFVQFSGWWGNKFGVQLGMNYHRAFGVSNLHLQAEWNVVRPYTYTFRDSVANYSHYHQALAHPLGANFSEWLIKADWTPSNKFHFKGFISYAIKGLDEGDLNYGGNILKDYDSRIGDENINLFQGLKSKVFTGSMIVQYKFFYNTFLYAELGGRNSIQKSLKKNNYWLEFGLRLNLDKNYFPY